jgi:hypothetical protein
MRRHAFLRRLGEKKIEDDSIFCEMTQKLKPAWEVRRSG